MSRKSSFVYGAPRKSPSSSLDPTILPVRVEFVNLIRDKEFSDLEPLDFPHNPKNQKPKERRH